MTVIDQNNIIDDGVKIYVPGKSSGKAISEPTETEDVKIYQFKGSVSSSSAASPNR